MLIEGHWSPGNIDPAAEFEKDCLAYIRGGRNPALDSRLVVSVSELKNLLGAIWVEGLHDMVQLLGWQSPAKRILRGGVVVPGASASGG